MARHRKCRQGKSRSNLLVYFGAVGMFAIAGQQCYRERQAEAAVTLMTGLGVLGIGAQSRHGQSQLFEVTQHLIDIRNNPAQAGTPITPNWTQPDEKDEAEPKFGL